MPASPLAAALVGQEQGGSFMDPAMLEAQPQLSLAKAMMGNAISTAPASPWEAAARVGQAIAGLSVQNDAVSELARAYSNSTDKMADALTQVSPKHPLIAALRSPDLATRMSAAKEFGKAMTLLGEGYDIGPGNQRQMNGVVVGENTNPRSPEGVLQSDINNANRAGARTTAVNPSAAPVPRTNIQPALPAQSQAGGIESVIGGGTGQPSPALSFNDRFPAAHPNNPLQGAIDTKAATTAAEKQAEAGVEFGDLAKQPPAPQKGPGGTEPLTTIHGTLVPPLTDQGVIDRSPAALKEAIPAWQKTVTSWNTGLVAGQDAEQRLKSIADAFKTINTGWGTEQKAQVNAIMKSLGLPQILPNADPASVEQSLHENYVQTLKRLQASVQGTGSRFTQMEFRLLSENAEHPNLQPEANLKMLTEDLAQLRQARDLPRDWQVAKQNGWQNPQSFEEAWLRQNPISGYTAAARKEIGPLKGMEGGQKQTQSVTQNAAQPPAPGARQAPDGNWYVSDPNRPGKYLRVE